MAVPLGRFTTELPKRGHRCDSPNTVRRHEDRPIKLTGLDGRLEHTSGLNADSSLSGIARSSYFSL